MATEAVYRPSGKTKQVTVYEECHEMLGDLCDEAPGNWRLQDIASLAVVYFRRHIRPQDLFAIAAELSMPPNPVEAKTTPP